MKTKNKKNKPIKCGLFHLDDYKPESKAQTKRYVQLYEKLWEILKPYRPHTRERAVQILTNRMFAEHHSELMP